jgi:hypothetical protein
MRHSSPINIERALQLALRCSNGDAELIAETIRHDLSRFFGYRLAVLGTALRRVEELRRVGAKRLIQPCNPPIH